MKISFSYIFKKKRIVFSVLLFFVIVTIFFPTPAHAAWYDRVTQAISNSLSHLQNSLTDAILAQGFSIANFIISFILMIGAVAAFMFSALSGSLLVWVINLSTKNISYTSLDPSVNPVISTGWPIVRDFANMFVVLMLIVIAVATILRIKNYEAQKLLPRLIIAALLINFSLVICGAFIDISNVMMRQFLIGSEASAAGNWLSKSDLKTFSTLISVASEQPPPDYIAKAAGSIFFFIMKGIISFLYVFLFLFRIMALWILVILSPLAFASAIAPATKSMIFDKWLHNFIQWCIIGVFGALFLYLGNQINAAVTAQAFPPVQVQLGDGLLQKALADSISRLAQFFIPGAFVVIGFISSLSLSAMGSGLALSAFKGSNTLLRQTRIGNGIESRAREIAGGGLRGLERVGLLQRGSTDTFLAKGNASLMKPHLERNKQVDNAGLIRLATGVTTRNTAAGAAAASTLIDRKVFDTIGNNLPPAEQENLQRIAIQNMINRGVDSKKAMENASDRTVAGLALNGERMGAISANTIRATAANTLVSRKQFGMIGSNLPPAQQERARREVMKNMINHGMDVAGATENSPSLARYNTKGIRDLTQTINPATRTAALPGGRNYNDAEAGDELVRRARRRVNLVDVATGEINHDLLDQTTSQKITRAADNMSADKVQAFRNLRDEAERERISNLTLAAAAAATRDAARMRFHNREAAMWERRRDKIDAARLPTP